MDSFFGRLTKCRWCWHSTLCLGFKIFIIREVMGWLTVELWGDGFVFWKINKMPKEQYPVVWWRVKVLIASAPAPAFRYLYLILQKNRISFLRKETCNSSTAHHTLDVRY